MKPLRMEQNRIDNRLGVLFAERDKLEAGFAVAELVPEKIAEAGQRLKLVAEEVERLETRWLELGARIDELTAVVD